MSIRIFNSLKWAVPIVIVGGVFLFFPDIFSVEDKDSFYVEEVKAIIN